MTQEDFEDRIADLVTDALQLGLTRDEVIDGLACQLQLLNDEQAAEEAEADHE